MQFDPLAEPDENFFPAINPANDTRYEDPVAWAKNELGVDVYSKQRIILRLLETVPKVAVPSCHDSGKTFLSSIAALRFLAKYPPGTARVVTTAPTSVQVRAILWNELNARMAAAPNALPNARITQTELWFGGYMAALGRKPSDYAPETFQGLHAEHILVIIDEAGSVPDSLWTAVDTLTTNAGARILAIGNPDDPTAKFREICDGALTQDGNGWTCVRIPAWETPNMSGEQVPPLLSRVLLSANWVEDKRKSWGEDSPLWSAKIAAEFADESSATIIRLADVMRARAAGPNLFRDDGIPALRGIQLGVDIAASDTGDETVIRERRGDKIGRRWAIRSGEPEDVSDLIIRAQLESQATTIHIDATGVGFGFLSDVRRRLYETRDGRNVAVMPFVAAARARDKDQFGNRRAEGYWGLREALRHGQLDLSEMENADDTVAELLTIKHKQQRGKILVEPKDDIRKRLGRSPDDSDALMMAVETPVSGVVPSVATVTSAVRRGPKPYQRVGRRRRVLHAAPAV